MSILKCLSKLVIQCPGFPDNSNQSWFPLILWTVVCTILCYKTAHSGHQSARPWKARHAGLSNWTILNAETCASYCSLTCSNIRETCLRHSWLSLPSSSYSAHLPNAWRQQTPRLPLPSPTVGASALTSHSGINMARLMETVKGKDSL